MRSASNEKREDQALQSCGSKRTGGPTDAATYDTWFREQVQAGIDAANAGDIVSDSEVEAEAKAWRDEVARTSGRSKA